MKNKPLRHKELNTFKFQPFSERISNINVDVFHRVCHKYEESEDKDDTFFYVAYKKWNTLNKSESYGIFRNEIDLCSIKTLPELLVQKDHVVQVLLEHLENKNPLSVQAILELVVALAQDLTQEFYVYYPQFHVKLISLLNTKDVDQLEWTFTCLAYLFKSLWRYIVKDLTSVFDSLIPLLSNNKPQYINNFAADSFAFVARKVKDKRSLLKLILSSLYKTKDGVSGYGRLLFATVSGIFNQFHSCAQPLLYFLFQSLSDEKLPRNLLHQVLDSMVENMTDSISPKHSEIFWSTIKTVSEEFLNNWKNNSDEKFIKGLCFLVQLMQKALKWRDATWHYDPAILLKLLIHLLQNDFEKLQLLIVDTLSMVIVSPRLLLTQEQSSHCINNVLSISNRVIIKKFIENTTTYSGFDLLILRKFIDFSIKEHPNDTLNLWTKVILHKAPPVYFSANESNRYIIDFHSNKLNDVTFSKLLLNELSTEDENKLINDIEKLLSILLIIPHIEPICETDALKVIQDLMKTVCNKLCNYESIEDNNKISKLLFFLLCCIKCCILIKKFKNIKEFNLPDIIVKSLTPLIKQHSQPLIVLHCLDLCIQDNKDMFSDEIKNICWGNLVDGLSSPFHQVRLLCTNLLLKLIGNEENYEIIRYLEFIAKAESLPTTVHDYREKLKILQKIECCPALVESKYCTLPLQYLLGVLYVNFKLMWDPVTKLITSYALQLPKNEFWSVFYSKLSLVKEQIKNKSDTTVEELFENTALNGFYSKINSLDDKPDHWNYRNMLWKIMPEFSEVCESKNRDIVPLFISFLEEEYFRTNADVASNWNIKLNPKSDESEEPMEIDEDVTDGNKIDENNTEKTENCVNESASTELPKFSLPGKSASKSLLAHLCIFGQLRDPKSMYQETELRNIYYELLTHKNPEVQKSSLDCIMAYKYKHVLPYRDHLYGLIDDKSFKDEITLFRIDTESDMVRPEHRQDLMPIVMRILYSKMLNKSGVRTGSKSAGQLRRSLVLRFLAGCHTDEIMLYLQMAFRIYTPFIKDTPTEVIKYVDATLDLGSMIPPRRLQSSINLLFTVLTYCGGLMSTAVLNYLLEILFCIGRIVACALKDRSIIHPGYIAPLRLIRNTALDSLSKFFELFETYPWTAEELDAVFEIYVWPWLPKLSVEGVHSPTSLLKLFMVWSKFQRYFPLLGKCNDDKTLDPLTSVMELLVVAGTHNSVCNAILEMVENLLTLQDLDKEEGEQQAHVSEIESNKETVIPLVVNNAAVFNCETAAEPYIEKLNYGSLLILNHIPSILERLKIKLSRKGGKYHLGKRDLTILSRATELVTDSATSDTLLSLIFPMILKKAKSGNEVLCPILNTVANLIKNVCNPGSYIYKLAPLFGLVSTAESRRLLTQIIVSVSRKGSEIDVELIEDLNAYDKRWIEQPDFNRRLDAFKQIRIQTDANELTVDMGIIIIYTCFYFLRTEKDLSIRDNASRCLQHLCPSLCLQYKNARDLLIEQTLLPLIASSIRNKQCDVIQQEAIVLLGYMVRECHELHPVFRDLSPLGNKVDLEVDFFENLQHLQLHRRVRALLKLTQVLKELKKAPSPRTVTQIILPLVTQFLCEEKYINKNTVVDAAIEALGTVSKLLSWHQYELILRYYLGKLQRNIDFQKQLVKIIVSILNGFHFDLSKAISSEKNEMVVDSNESMIDNKDEVISSVNENENKMEVNKNENEVKTVIKDNYSSSNDENNEEDEEGDNEVLNDNEKEEKELEDNLAKAVREDVEEETIEDCLENEQSKISLVCVVDKITVLSKSGAVRVIRIIRHNLLVQLLRSISMRSQSDIIHKLNRKQLGPDRDEEDILRIPIALAAVKLLQKLPVEILEQNLSGIFMKLCTFLKSRLDSVRRVTRETLQKVMIALGPNYLSVLITEMTELLTKGFHVHVLVYTLHSVLVSMKDLFQVGHLDICVQPILQVCKLDLFGNASEEKEVAQIASKLIEARANKSYNIFHILGEFISEKCLLDVVLPLKEELSNSLSHKVIHKAAECLRQLVLGLVDNKFVNTESMLIFAYGVTSESIPSLVNHNTASDEKNKKQKETSVPLKPDSFLIPEDPKTRPKFQTKQCAKTNAHVLVEFGLQLYHFLLKRDKVKGPEFRPHLDPVVSLLYSCLTSQHMKINSLAIQCLCWILKKDLPSVKDHIKKITQSLFSILHKYAAAGLSKGDNFDLVMAAFKAVAVIVRDVKCYKLENDQLQALLLYCEQDIHDHSRQATAFTLLKAILGRKLNIPELHEVMVKVEELSITSHLDHSRLQARQIVLQFLSEYQLGKKFSKHLNFYLTQVDYDLQTGRESALEMLLTLVKSLPENRLKEHSGLLFVTIAVRLVNDDVPECRQKAAEIITSLLQHVNKNEKNNLFDIVLLWMKDKTVSHRRLAAQLCGIFVTIEQENFENNLPALLPIILQQFYDGFKENQPGMYVRLQQDNDQESIASTMQDHHLYQLLLMLVKLTTHCPKMLTNSAYAKNIETIAVNSQKMLAHPHEWVRLSAAQLLGRIISVLNPEEVAAIANGDKSERTGFLLNDVRDNIRSFTLDHCYQLSPGVEIQEKLLMQCMKNLVFVAEVLQDVKPKQGEKTPLSLSWLVRLMRKLIHIEVAQTQQSSTIVRTMVFHWMAAIALKLKQESLLPVVPHIIAPIVREMNMGDEGAPTLKQIAKEASGYVKRKIGSEEFNRLITNYTSRLDIKRAIRKKERAQQVITAPEKAAKRKIMKQQKKKEQKKRKIDALKKQKVKRKRKREIDIDD
ncbi:small subunit processome component 20 homolog [Lycorma delicatula]|uniref:small subunit processome component 20 homolog n=1 Tax=Lycorma delicatula TaxID=130591 RepID=UPI003F50D4FD